MEAAKQGVHTPTPWKVVKVSYQSSAYYIQGGGKDKRSPYIAHIPRSTIQPMKANAAFIVRACNSHAELLDVARGILADDMIPLLPAEYIARVRAALAKAGAA